MSDTEQLIEWLTARIEDSRESYKRDTNSRHTDISLGKLRAYRDVRTKLYGRAESECENGTEESEELVYGGVCPVCGDEFTDGFERLSELEGESIEDVRICVIDPPEENLFHLPEDQSETDAEQFFKLAAEFDLDELLPEWEISVIESGDLDTWEHYHPRAATEERAREKALDEANSLGSKFENPRVYEVLLGPYADGVGKETVQEVLES